MKIKRFILTLFVVSATIAAHHVAAQRPETVDAKHDSPTTITSGKANSDRSFVRFLLACRNGPCARVYYTVCYPSGVAAIGETDASGYTMFYEANNVQSLKLLLGHRRLGDCEDRGRLGIGVTREVQSR
ncbi:hypothetical protein Bphyt_2601 [Paraburkholderia phytofirmans PsJN]|uniref:Uncharacterized protein n=1 Tax=Paraburkholderia phytofirmans (strain DSM 17436 / LMG 22146 / PsJN) TaxID=398527 RepID=B2T5P4_PARPJ|nr:hypothetical protein Bphyt_2601 [Paraburkholderia phytofirmans PsJN]